jgi:hypothetical protein
MMSEVTGFGVKALLFVASTLPAGGHGAVTMTNEEDGSLGLLSRR